MELPKNWPSAFQYAPTSVYADGTGIWVRHLLHSSEVGEAISLCIEEQRVHPHLQIERITPELCYKGPQPHPLSSQEIFQGHFQHGVFATQPIPKDTELGEYVGEIFLTSSSREQTTPIFKGVHCWMVRFHHVLVNVSSQNIANEMAFVNDYRGLQKVPNVRVKWILHRGRYYLGYETTRDIEAREEILVDYGHHWEKIRPLA